MIHIRTQRQAIYDMIRMRLHAHYLPARLLILAQAIMSAQIFRIE